MDEATRRAMQWLDDRYHAGVAEGQYVAHEPIYGAGGGAAEANQAVRLAQSYSLLRYLSARRPRTLLDVGGAEGYHASLVQRVLSAQVVTSDLSREASRRAREFFALPAVANDAHWLPYANDAFDVVLCGEVLEHVSDPVAVMCEVLRVARRYAVFSTEQVVRLAREREILLLLGDRSDPHAEHHWFLPEDFGVVLGLPLVAERQSVITDRCAELMMAEEEARPEEVRALVAEMTRRSHPPSSADHGLLVVKTKRGAAPVAPAADADGALLDALLAHRIGRAASHAEASPQLDPFLPTMLVCPLCLASLEVTPEALRCPTCRRGFAVRHGVPCLHLEASEEEIAEARRRRWPWLGAEGRRLRAAFTAPRPVESRLLYNLVELELGLLGFCQSLPAPAVEALDSGAVRHALLAISHGPQTRLDRLWTEPRWWDELPADTAEGEAVHELGANLLRLRARVAELETHARERSEAAELLSRQLGRIYSRRPVRALLWVKQLLRDGGRRP